MKRLSPMFLILLAFLLCLSGCDSAWLAGVSERSSSEKNGSLAPVSPDGENGEGSSQTVSLYYGFRDEAYLMPVDTQLQITGTKTIEWAVVEALIEGPSADRYDLVRLIDSATEIVAINVQNGYLAVTLSEDFLNVPMDVVEYWSQSTGQERDENAIRRLAVYSIVNSITGMGKYARVLLLVDQDGDGVGEKLIRSQIGLSDSPYEPIEPLSRDSEMILSPEKTVQLAMNALIEKDWDTLDLYLSLYTDDGSERPGWAELSDAFASYCTLVSCTVVPGIIVAEDGQSAALSVEIVYVGAAPSSSAVLPLRLVREEGMWRIQYSALCAVLPVE